MSIENLKLGKSLSTKMEEKKDTTCLSDNTLSEFIENKLSYEEREKVLEHLNSCRDCFEVYKVTSSTLADLKKVRKSNITRSLSIAASIMFVFLIGFYYSNFYKTQPEVKEEKLEFRTKRIKRDISPVEAELSKEESFVNRDKDMGNSEKDLKDSLRNSRKKKIRKGEKPLKMIIGDDVKPALKAKLDGVDITKSRSIEGGIGETSKYGKSTDSIERKQINQKKKRVSRKPQTVVEMEEKTLNDEDIVREPKVFKKENKISKSSEMRFKTEHIKDTGKWKKKSSFSLLSKQGFVYKTKNSFGKLNNDQILILLSKWKKILPDLRGSERDIALETIKYLQNEKNRRIRP